MQMNSFLWEEKFAYCVPFGYYLIKKQLRSEKTTLTSINSSLVKPDFSFQCKSVLELAVTSTIQSYFLCQ